MKWNAFIAGLCLTAAAVAVKPVQAQTAQTKTQVVTVDGEVIRYEPGQIIVVRGADNKETTYTLAPTVVVPTDVKIGRRVTLFTEPGPDGSTRLVSRVTTTTLSPDGAVKKTTEDTRTSPSGTTTKTTTTSISGKVVAYDMGKTVTITRNDGSKVTYILNDKSKVPADLVAGKVVTILPLPSSTPEQTVVETITYATEPPPQN
jgi:hypothetical protein